MLLSICMKSIVSENREDEFRELVAFSVIFYVIPLFLLSFGYIPFEARHGVLFLMGLILVAYAIQKNISPRDLGLRKDNLKMSLLVNFLLSLVLIGLMFLLYFVGVLKEVNQSPLWFLSFYILLSVPVQEYIFRSLMMHELGIFTKNKYVLVIFSAIIYSLAHVMYHSWQVIGITAIAGLIWGYVYLKYPNFWGVTLSHALVGAAAVFVGLV